MNDLAEITRCYTITFERRSQHAVERLWHAITDSDEVGAWMKYPARIDLRVGGDYFVDFGDGKGLEGIIVRLERERMLSIVWGMSILQWQIEPDGGCSTYTFTHHGQDPPISDETDDIPAGWHLWLDELEAHLEGIEIGPLDAHAKHQKIHPAYIELRNAALGRA